LAKTDTPDPRLEGTIHTAAAAIEAAGGKAVPVVGDVREETSVARAVDVAVESFGGIDIVINNASAIDLRRVEELEMKRYDLMQAINVRGTFLLSRLAIPHLRASENGHILTLSPPLDLDPGWIGAHLGYTLSKYGMSLCTIGLAEELRDDGIAANSLWPRTTIATDAVRNLLGGEELAARSRSPRIMADAAYAILRRPASECSGNLFIDDDVLAAEGIDDLSVYGGGEEPETDIFVGPPPSAGSQ
jgi:citronellol/citronellal dehydrogenase